MEKEIIEIQLKFLYMHFIFSSPFPGGAVASPLLLEILKLVVSFWCVCGGDYNTESSAAGLLFQKECDLQADCVFLLILGSTFLCL